MRRAACAVGLLVAACSVDRSALDEEIFPCRAAGDCIDGYGCQPVDAIGSGFCAPAPQTAAECSGFLTSDGLCLTECRPDRASCDEGLTCVSNEIIGASAGYCIPASTCSSDADCGGDGACLSTVVEDFVDLVWGPMQFPGASHLTCVPRCGEQGECPTGTECLDSLVPSLRYCLPRCGDDSQCPLGFACYATAGTSIGICMPGIPGLACRDDASCLVGECTMFEEEGESIQLCVSTCDGAVQAPDCTDASRVDGRLNVFQCVPVLGAEYCVFRSGYLHACDLGGGALQCAEGLECRDVPDPRGGGRVQVCVADCRYELMQPNQDGDGDCADNAFCFPGASMGFIDACVFDLLDGTQCGFDDQCASGVCDYAVHCGDPPEDELGCCVAAR